ncbi:hypothetical protein [Hydrogenimonas sp.]
MKEKEDRKENIFFNLIRSETGVTEAFCNLMQIKVFRDMFLNFVSSRSDAISFDPDNIKYRAFSSEKPLEMDGDGKDTRAGRADIAIDIKGLDYIFELKIEVNTRLTANQPERYLEYLKDQNPEFYKERLFFILPEGYWYRKVLENHPQVAKCNIFYWEDLLEEIKKRELDRANVFIGEFCRILESNWFYYESVVFGKSELDLLFLKKEATLRNSNLPSVMRKLFTVVNGVCGKIDCIGKYDRQQEEWFGYIVNNNKYGIKKGWEIWFGIDYELWEKEGDVFTVQILSGSGNEDEVELIAALEIEGKGKIKEFVNSDNDVINYFSLDAESLAQEEKNIIKEFTSLVSSVIQLVNKGNL